MIAKDSFVIYTGFWKPISRLSDEQLGRLFRALYLYQLGEPCEVGDDIVMAYDFFINQFEVDNKKYQNYIDGQREAGRKGGRKGRAKQEAEEMPVADNIEDNPENKASLSNDDSGKGRLGSLRVAKEAQATPSLNENENENENENVFFQKKEKRLICSEFFLSNANDPIAETKRFLDYNRGKPIADLAAYVPGWKCLGGKGRFPSGPLEWLRHVLGNAELRGDPDATRAIITGIRAMVDNSDRIIITCTGAAREAIERNVTMKPGKGKRVFYHETASKL